MREAAEVISEYHKRVINEIGVSVPTFYIRYEDLRSHPQQTLEKVFCFLLEVDSIEGLNIQKRIKHVVDQGHSASVSYNQKIGEEQKVLYNRNIDQFSKDQ